MERLIDWFWNYKSQRNGWIISNYGLSLIKEAAKRQNLSQNMSKKPCVAFWGASQSGKSSLLSYYIDGDQDSKSAISWGGENVRFSSEEVNIDGVVFNPFNGGMDASGLVTRFYLPENESIINEKFPVEIILSSRRQILHSLALGYHLECQVSENPWTLENIYEKVENPSSETNKDAFDLLCDLCDVCQNISCELPKYRFFDEPFRQRVLNSSCCDDYNLAMSLVTYLLWDNVTHITNLFEGLLKAQNEINDLLAKTKNNKIYVSMEFASYLEDIGIISFYEQNKNCGLGENKKIDSLNQLMLCISPNGIYYSCGDTKDFPRNAEKYKLNFDEFCFLQALISELRIPLKNVYSENTKPFYDFLGKCDLLDLPGVTNKAIGDALGVENLISFQREVDKNNLLARVYKTGKTLSTIHEQSKNCLIDSLIVFVDLQRAGGMSRPGTINNGVNAWLSSYELNSENLKSNLFINFSLFGKLCGEVVAAINGGGLGKYCDKVDELTFFSDYSSNCFFTTNKFLKCNEENLLDQFFDDRNFKDKFLSNSDLGQESIKKLFNDGLGTNFLFDVLSQRVTTQTREEFYKSRLSKDRKFVKNEILSMLPSSEDEKTNIYKNVLQNTLVNVDKIINSRENESILKLEQVIKSIFYIDDALLDFVPTRIHSLDDAEIRNYIDMQVSKWIQSKKRNILPEVKLIVEESQFVHFLELVSTLNYEILINKMREIFYVVHQNVSRTIFANILINSFLYGGYYNTSKEENNSQISELILAFINRIKKLQTEIKNVKSNRPENIRGDDELRELIKEL